MASAPLHDPVAPPEKQVGTEVCNTTCYRCAYRCGNLA